MDKILKRSIRDAADAVQVKLSAVGAFSIADCLTEFKSSQAELWESSRDQAADEWLSGVFRRILQRSLFRPASAQLPLPLPEFEIVPTLFRIEHQWIATEKANLEQLRCLQESFNLTLAKSLERSERDQQIADQIDELVRVVALHSRSNPDITTGEALKKRHELASKRKRVTKETRKGDEHTRTRTGRQGI